MSVGKWFKILWGVLTSRKNVPVLAMVGTILGAMATMFTWQTSKIANEVSKASQAFAQKVYQDQLVMGAPSISIVSGETLVAAYQHYSGNEKGIPMYAVSIVLRNSGQRDAKRVWVAVMPEGFYSSSETGSNAQLLSLPKDVDIPVRFDLKADPSTSQNAAWYVGYIYEDELPRDHVAPSSGSSESHALTSTALHVACSNVEMTKLTSWPKNVDQEPTIRNLSSGSPVAVGQAPDDNYAQGFSDGDILVRDALKKAIATDTNCQGS